MPGGINGHHFVQHRNAGLLLTPGLCIFTPGSGGEGVQAFPTNLFPGPPAEENAGADVSWRAYHRSLTAPNSVGGVLYMAWHGADIFALTASPNWSSVLAIVGMNAARGNGDHTGLYIVHSADGTRSWVVGLFRTTTNTIGFVKLDLLANTWSQGDTGLGSHSGPFGLCIEWQGELMHAGSSGLLRFDPETDALSIAAYPGQGAKDVLTICRDRVWVVARAASTQLRILEWIGFGMVDHGGVTGATENTNAAGGWSILDFVSGGRFYVFYYSTSGGTGWRCERVVVNSATLGDPPTLSDLTNPVIPDSPILGPDPLGNYRWPAALLAHGGQEWIWAPDNSEWPIGAFGTSGGIFGVGHLSAPGIAGTKYGTTAALVGWNGEGSAMSNPKFPTGIAFPRHYSFPTGRWGTNEKFFIGGTGTWIESAVPYSDGTVSRGILIKFRTNEAGTTDVQFLTDSERGGTVAAGDTPATLSVGDGIAIGGSAALDAVNAKVTGIVPGTLYQIIWDLVTDSVPAQAWRMLRPVTRPNTLSGPPAPGNDGVYEGGPAAMVFTGLSAANQGVPFVTQSPVAEPVVLSDSPPLVTQSPVAEPVVLSQAAPLVTQSPVAEPAVVSGAAPFVTQSPVAEPLAQQQPVTPDLARAQIARPYLAPGGLMGWETDGANIADRPSFNLQAINPLSEGVQLEATLSIRPDIRLLIPGIVELGRATIDGVNDAAASLHQIVDHDAALLDTAMVLAVKPVLRTVSGFVSGPQISLGTGGAYDQQMGTTLVNLVAALTQEDLAPASPVLLLTAGQILSAQLDVQAVATAYVFDVVVYGIHRLG